jgi:hypothetical protein
MYIIYKMPESTKQKRKRSSSPSTSSTSAYNKIMAIEGVQYNKIIDDLKLRNYADGLQYIEDNNLQEWLKTQIRPEAEMSTEAEINIKALWHIFYENNIYKEPNKIENLQPGPQVTMGGGQSVFKKRKNKTQKNIGGASSLTSMILPVDAYFERHWNTLTVLTLRDNKGKEVCRVYGSSLPKNDGIPKLYKYLYDKIGIKDIISFQDCDNTQDLVHINSCRKRGYNQTGSYSQAKIWEQISIPKQVTLSTGTRTARGTRTFIVNEEKDMTAGAISNFDLLIQQPIWERRTLVHCLAGFGRTGTALLYYCIRTLLLYGIDGLNYTNLTHKFFGFTNTNFSSSLSSCVYMSSCMYNFFKIRFEMNLSLHTNNKWNSMVQGSIYHHSKMVEEVFKIDTINQANLFVARINYILLYTALFLNAQTDHDQFPGIQQSPIRASPIRATPITHIYLYPLHTQYPQQQSGRIVSMFTPDYVFKNPDFVDINHFDAKNEYGLKLKNIPHI